MSNNKGFTLTEVLLAAMIVGIIGIALAALTTAALRESSVGRTRIMLRNQISLFLRQLRQDVQEADTLVHSSSNRKVVALDAADGHIDYNCCGGDIGNTCQRVGTKKGVSISETVLDRVQCDVEGSGLFFTTESVGENETGNVKSILTVRLLVGSDGNPPVREFVEETFILPQGVVTKP